MKRQLQRTTLFALYQSSVAVGILLMPVALLMRRTVGVSIPLHRVLNVLERAYDRTDSDSY